MKTRTTTRNSTTTKTRTKTTNRPGRLAALALALLVAAAARGATAHVNGKVVDESGQIVTNVRVVATNPEVPKKHWDAVSDPSGEFVLALPAGPATYLLQTDGSHRYAADQQAVKIEADETVSLVFTLHIKH